MSLSTCSHIPLRQANQNNLSYAPSILVVDDVDSQRLLLSKILTNKNFSVSQARNGLEALSMLAQKPFDVVLSDWMMPEMSGLELCAEMSKRVEERPYFVIMTGRDSRSDIVKGLDAGADDFLSKPINTEELLARLQAGLRIVNMQKVLKQRNQQLQRYVQQQKLAAEKNSKELALASQLLLSLLPHQVAHYSPNMSAHGLLSPASVLGGDFYNHFKLDDTHVGFYLIDVVGHGVAAALNAHLIARTLLPNDERRSFLYQDKRIKSPREVAQAINLRFFEESSTTQYFTMVYGVYDLTNHQVTFCQAGSFPPLMLSAEGKVKHLGDNGFPVGLIAQASYEEHSVTLAAGERLYLFSDGFIEMQQDDESFGENFIVSLMQANQSKPLLESVEAFRDATTQFLEYHQQRDDMSFLVIEHSESTNSGVLS